ncbi:MAG: hypothetical protein QOD42_2995 [Sphingomonadales bacterium]|jgi:hypothetical protein|nr:hypothetical protein [Sphingomonadales bacterium]
MRTLGTAGAALAAAASLAACVPRREAPAPLPPVRPAPEAPPVRTPPPPPPPADWQAAPLSPGDWSYRPNPATPEAIFRSEGVVSFAVSCERGRSVRLRWVGARAQAIAIRTSYGERQLPVSEVHVNMVTVDLPPGDPLLEQIAFSRGRFLVQAEGAEALILPAWPEPARVIEDCRGQ